VLCVSGGEVWDGTNDGIYELDLKTSTWTRLEQSAWRAFVIQAEKKYTDVEWPVPEAFFPEPPLEHIAEFTGELNVGRVVVCGVPVSYRLGEMTVRVTVEGSLAEEMVNAIVERAWMVAEEAASGEPIEVIETWESGESKE
jgi:hypothetical protein